MNWKSHDKLMKPMDQKLVSDMNIQVTQGIKALAWTYRSLPSTHSHMRIGTFGIIFDLDSTQRRILENHEATESASVSRSLLVPGASEPRRTMWLSYHGLANIKPGACRNLSNLSRRTTVLRNKTPLIPKSVMMFMVCWQCDN